MSNVTEPSEAAELSRIHTYPPKHKDPIQQKVVLYTSIDITGSVVMRSTLENLLEHVGKDTRNTSRHPPPYVATKTPLATKLPWITST